MGAISAHLNRSRHDLAQIALYALCVLPISIDGFGVNYLFTLIPVWFLLSGRTLQRPSSDVVLFMYGCVATFLISSAYQYEWIEFFDRRLISFILFMTMFFMCFVRITEEHIASFKLAVLIGALLFSLNSLLTFVSLGLAAQAFESKDIVGSQRYGFVYILAFWVIWYDTSLRVGKLVRLVILLTLVLGITLTFSRATIVAFGASGLVAIALGIATSRRSIVSLVGRIAAGLVFALLGILAVYLVAPIIFDFFYIRLFEYILSGASAEALADPETSDGTRVFIWTHILEYVVRNPVTGAGFLGVWVLNLFEGFSGSSHSQYFDALFRLGPLLFFGYLYFIFKILKHYARTDIGLFVGITGVLVYGLFHETFKESHGTFILSMLLAESMRPRGARPFKKVENPI